MLASLDAATPVDMDNAAQRLTLDIIGLVCQRLNVTAWETGHGQT